MVESRKRALIYNAKANALSNRAVTVADFYHRGVMDQLPPVARCCDIYIYIYIYIYTVLSVNEYTPFEK